MLRTSAPLIGALDMRDLISRDLPAVPDQLVDGWLLPFTSRVGWPPTKGNDWRYILGLHRDLEYLQRCTWERKTIAISPSIFVRRDLGIVVNLFRTHVLKEATIFSDSMSDGLARFTSCKDYLTEHGSFPWPVVIESSREGYHILDGYHRLSAYCYLFGYFKIENEEVPCLKVAAEQQVWIGTHV